MQVADDPVVGDLEDRRLAVLVDRDDGLRVCMPARCWMAPEIPTAMYRFGDTVTPVWPTWWCGTSRRPPRRGRPDGGTERVGQLIDQRELLGRAEAAAAGDHDRGLGELRARAPFSSLTRSTILAPLAASARVKVDALLGARARGGLDGSGVGAHRDDRGALGHRATGRLMPPPKMDWSATRPSSMPHRRR